MYSKGGPRIATIHKSKGLESPAVIFYLRDKCPADWVRKNGSEDALEQEYNLIYVGITRAETRLYYVNSDKNADSTDRQSEATITLSDLLSDDMPF